MYAHWFLAECGNE